MVALLACSVGNSLALGTDRHVPSQYPTIQQAITAAVPGDEVIIAPGTYQGDGNRDIDFLGKAITVRSTDPNDPNVVAATIIKCNPHDPNDPDDPNYYAEHRGFYFHSGEDANSVLAGVSVEHGDAPVPEGSTYHSGGAVACVASDSPGSCPTITRCVLRGNHARYGGGIYCLHSDPKIDACLITENTTPANGTGGGIQCGGGSNPTIIACIITGNQAGHGGGIYSHLSPTVSECTVSGNSAVGDGGGIYCQSGSPFISTSVICENEVGNSGGGIACMEGSSPVIISCTIADNLAMNNCGGIKCLHSDPDIIGCTIAGNSANRGGGIQTGPGSTPTVTNCLIAWNSAQEYGGGVRANPGTLLTITNSTITGNSALLWGGGTCFTSDSVAVLTNCVVWGNESAQGAEVTMSSCPATLTISYSDVAQEPNDIYVEPGCTLTWGDGNIDVDPCFVDPNGPDGDPNTWEDNDYHLSPNSPCINTGDPYQDYSDQTDIDGQRRLMGAGVDMGSDEYLYPILNLTVTGDNYGWVVVDPNQAYYEPNGTVTLTADWDDGRAFVGWTGDVPNGHEHDNPLVITMDADKDITATFKCGLGAGPMMPLVLLGLLGFAVLRRRR